MNDLEALKAALDDAEREERSLIYERRSKMSRLLDAEAKRIDGEMEAEYGDRTRAIAISLAEAQKAVTEAEEASALAGTDCYGKQARFPLGSIVSEWKLGGTHWDKNRKRVKTGRRAIYESVTRTSQFGDNLSSYSRPKVGEFILRLLKKDGTPGLKFLSRGWDFDCFKLDGEEADPEDAQ